MSELLQRMLAAITIAEIPKKMDTHFKTGRLAIAAGPNNIAETNEKNPIKPTTEIKNTNSEIVIKDIRLVVECGVLKILPIISITATNKTDRIPRAHPGIKIAPGMATPNMSSIQWLGDNFRKFIT